MDVTVYASFGSRGVYAYDFNGTPALETGSGNPATDAAPVW
jgi:hypothetical protein